MLRGFEGCRPHRLEIFSDNVDHRSLPLGEKSRFATRSAANQGDRDLCGWISLAVAVASVVVIRDNDDLPPAKECLEVGLPLTCTARITGGNEADPGEPVHVVLAFNNERGTIGWSVEELGNTVRPRRMTLHRADRFTVTIGRPALPEIFRFEAADYKEIGIQPRVPVIDALFEQAGFSSAASEINDELDDRPLTEPA
jgi:hypothetical protein